ncbi:hypothetical protein [Wenyingzhuangia fucanilytica]|nr:hypothetical protein [Wenyingzhuangia fucanilytica]
MNPELVEFQEKAEVFLESNKIKAAEIVTEIRNTSTEISQSYDLHVYENKNDIASLFSVSGNSINMVLLKAKHQLEIEALNKKQLELNILANDSVVQQHEIIPKADRNVLSEKITKQQLDSPNKIIAEDEASEPIKN